MKKVLLGTTALVTAGLVSAGAAAEGEGLTLSVNGYYQAVVSTVWTNADDYFFGPGEPDTVQVRHEGELSFNGAYVMDNGMTAGVEINLEATNGAGSGMDFDIDEAYAFLEGSFGRIQIGEEAGAAYLMHYTSPYFVGAFGVDSPNFSSRTTGVIGVYPRTATYITLSGDTNKVTYFTPRVMGIQLGVSYTPQSIPGDVGGQNSAGASQAFGNTTKNSDVFDNIIDVGLNYSGMVTETVELGISAGLSTADGNGVDDPLAISGGINVGFGGFLLGGGVYWSDDVVAEGVEELAYTAALQYATGPWTFGAGFLRSKIEEDLPFFVNFPFSIADGNKYTVVEAGVQYALGNGVSVFGVFDHYRDHREITDFTIKTNAVSAGIDLAF